MKKRITEVLGIDVLPKMCIRDRSKVPYLFKYSREMVKVQLKKEKSRKIYCTKYIV